MKKEIYSKRNRAYKKVDLDKSFPDFIVKNKMIIVNGYYKIDFNILFNSEISILISPVKLTSSLISLFNFIFL